MSFLFVFTLFLCVLFPLLLCYFVSYKKSIDGYIVVVKYANDFICRNSSFVFKYFSSATYVYLGVNHLKFGENYGYFNANHPLITKDGYKVSLNCDLFISVQQSHSHIINVLNDFGSEYNKDCSEYFCGANSLIVRERFDSVVYEVLANSILLFDYNEVITKGDHFRNFVLNQLSDYFNVYKIREFSVFVFDNNISEDELVNS